MNDTRPGQNCRERDQEATRQRNPQADQMHHAVGGPNAAFFQQFPNLGDRVLINAMENSQYHKQLYAGSVDWQEHGEGYQDADGKQDTQVLLRTRGNSAADSQREEEDEEVEAAIHQVFLKLPLLAQVPLVRLIFVQLGYFVD
jgi:hypothetical protein